MNKIINMTVTVRCRKKMAFEMFTKNDHLENWFTKKADVIPEKGGKYELYFVKDDEENDNTKGCKILCIEPANHLCFEWKGPKQYKHFMNSANPLTTVTVVFNSVHDFTKISIIHTGWKNSEEWEEARSYFVKAWNQVLENLVNYVNTLPDELKS